MELDIAQLAARAVEQQDCKKGWNALEQGDFVAAQAHFEAALEKGSDAQAYHGLGQALGGQGRDDEAARQFQEALKHNPYNHEIYGALGDLFAKKRQGIPAIENYAQAVAANPELSTYKQKLVKAMSGSTIKNINENLKGILIECLEAPDVDLGLFGTPWLGIIKSDPNFAVLYSAAKQKTYDSFKSQIEKYKTLDALIDPFFLTGLGKFIVVDQAFERWCMHLRRFLLEGQSARQSLFTDEEDIDFITCALSRFCLLTDYILDVSEQETPLVEALKEKIEKTDTPRLCELALYGCYHPLCTLKNAQEIAEKLEGGDHVSQIPKGQIEEYFRQQEIKQNIESLTEIKDAVSAVVQEQYEAFPYPRWVSVPKDLFDQEAEGHLKGKKAQILVAGCGTGKEAIQLAYVFPDAQILAVDLSRTSLAYAIDKSNEFGLENITFRHGDIMELGKLDQKFDYIASAGVLHHMKDPKAGWEIITSLLKPGGLMRIGLYSRTARRSIIAAREKIAQEKIGSDAASIRAFRKNAKDHLKYADLEYIRGFLDYYSLPECRDLLFHVQEHQFDLLEIKDLLDDLGLEFLKFYHAHAEIEKYKKKHADDRQGRDLESWARWEEKNPDLFIAMYRFWCRKKS